MLDNDRELLPTWPCTCSLRTVCGAKFDVAEGPGLIQRMNFPPNGKRMVYSEQNREVTVEGGAGGDHSRCGSKFSWELQIQQQKNPKLRIFNEKFGFGCYLALDTKVTTRYWSAKPCMNLSSQWSDTHFSGSPKCRSVAPMWHESLARFCVSSRIKSSKVPV